MIISTGRSRKDTRWRQKEVSWDELVSLLGKFTRTRETVREYKAMTKDDRGNAKDIGGFVGGKVEGGRRLKESVTERSLITIDADQAYDGQWLDYSAMYGGAFVCYSTHSHTAEAPRLRFVFPLNRAVTPDEYCAIARKIGERLGMDTLDPTTFEVHRLMYWPSSPVDGEQVYYVGAGEWVNADTVLSEYGLGEAWKDTSLWPICSSEDEVRLSETKRQGEPGDKPGIVGLFCRTYDIHEAISEFLSDVYDPCDDGVRYTYKGGSTYAGAVSYDDKFLYSHHATDPASGQLCNAFDLVRLHKFGAMDKGAEAQEITRRESYKKMCEFAAGLDAVKEKTATEHMAEVDGLFDGGEGDGGVEWTHQLTINSKTKEVECTIRNAVLIFSNDPRLKDTFALNELLGRPVIRRRVPWRSGERVDELNGTPWTDADNANLRLYMEATWGFAGRDRIQDAFDVVCEANRFHPVRDYLGGLVWDGESRLETMLIRYMGAEDNSYIRAATRKWMAAAVKRVMEPGCKFDNMLVLVGRQGIGKSNLAKTISRGWFTDSLGRMDASKDAYERLSGVWIVEIAELAAAKKAEVEDIKNFVSKTEDSFRRAYQRETGCYKRQCVFYATTNDPEFLRDRTGGRRFWPIEVKGIGQGELRGLEAEVDQLWAEAKEVWRRGESLWMDTEELAELARMAQDEHMVEDELVAEVREYLDRGRPMNWYALSPEDRVGYFTGLHDFPDPELDECLYVDRVCASEIRCELCGESRTKGGGNDMLSRKIAGIMNNLPGWERWRVVVPGYPKGARGWRRVSGSRVLRT